MALTREKAKVKLTSGLRTGHKSKEVIGEDKRGPVLKEEKIEHNIELTTLGMRT